MGYLLTIAIPTYNRCELLVRLIESILPQKTEEVEVLVIDNASTDGTEKAIRKYSDIRFIKNETNIGPDRNFLKCYQEAKGKYVWLIGSDDILLPNALGCVVSALSDYDVSLMAMNYVSFKDESELPNIQEDKKTEPDLIVTGDKNEFMLLAKMKTTFISSFLLRKDNYLNVENPEAFIGTYFIHSCIGFAATKENNLQYAYLKTPIIAADITADKEGQAWDYGKQFEVFGERLYKVFCETAPQYGYSPDTMKKVYFQYVREMWPRMILGIKARKGKNWYAAFKKYGLKYIKQDIRSVIVTYIAIITPCKIAQILKGAFGKK